jgi:uncharacterized protein YoxC
MSDPVLVALITGGFGVLMFVMNQRTSGKLKRLSGDVKATRYQVENNHDTNLREEGDERHNENSDKLDAILSEIKSLRGSVSRLWQRSDKHTDQIHDLELTQPPRRTE